VIKLLYAQAVARAAKKNAKKQNLRKPKRKNTLHGREALHVRKSSVCLDTNSLRLTRPSEGLTTLVTRASLDCRLCCMPAFEDGVLTVAHRA
jgi:hypothetical protein